MPEIVYLLCAATSLLCAGLLGASYRRHRSGLVMWSLLCFVGLAINNLLLVVDLVFVPEIDLSILRMSSAIAGLGLLVVGLIWEAR